jgi:hypothetical protein
MTINIADNTARVSYSVAEGVQQTSFAVPFEFFDNDDLNVYVDGTLKTITADYTVSGGDGSTGTVSITVTGATGGSTVVITRDIELERTTDFPVSGSFNIVALNTELDRIIAIAADLDDRASRALQLTDYDVGVGLTLPVVDDRKGKTLAFNLTTGAVEAGPSTADVQSVSDTAADIALLADIEDGTLATNAITNVNTIRTDVTTVSGISGNVTTVAGNNANVTTVATDLSGSDTIGTVAGSISNVNTVATDITNVNTTATNIADVNTVAGEIGVTGVVTIVATAITDVSTVSDDIAAVITAANDLNEAVSEIDTVSNSIANVDTVGTNITSVNTVATDIADVNTVATDIANVNTVATANANVGAVATDITNVNTVAGQISPTNNISTVAGISTEIAAVAGDATDIGTVAADLAGSNTIGTVAGDISNVNSVAGNSTNINAVAGNATNIDAVAADATDIGTVAAGISNINTVATDITNVNTVATNITGVNSFAERYRVGGTDPTTSLDEGDLFFNTTDNTYKFYDGTQWNTVNVSGIGSVVEDTTPQLGGVLSTSGNNIEFGDSSGAEVNRLKLGDGDDLQIYHDGTHNYIEAGSTTSSDLKIVSTDDIIIGHGTGASYETMATFLSDSSVNLYYNNSAKLATQNTGVYVTGDLTTSDDLFVNGGFASVSSASTAVFRLINTDTAASGDQELGTFDFYGSDSTTPGAGVKASIAAHASGFGSSYTYLKISNTGDGVNDLETIRIYSTGTHFYNRHGLVIYDSDNSNYSEITVPTDITSSYTMTLPSAGPSAADQILVSDASGNLSFEDLLSERYNSVTSSSNATTIDLNDGTNFSHTLTENTTFTFSNPAASGRVSSFTLKLVQDASASGYTVAWPAAVDWPSATAPTLTATASAVDYFVFITHDGGTTWYGFTAGQALG